MANIKSKFSKNDAAVIGERLRDLRGTKRLSQEKVAEHLDVSKDTYMDWENGERDVRPWAIVKLADFYNVSADYILGRSSYKTISGDDLHKLTGLSDEALQFLIQKNGGPDPAHHPEADTISILLADHIKNGPAGVFTAIREYLHSIEGYLHYSSTTGQAVPSPGDFTKDISIQAAQIIQINTALQNLRGELGVPK